MFLKIVAITLAVIILVLLGVLAFAKPVHSPTSTPSPSSSDSTISSDGHLKVDLPHSNDLALSPLAIEGSVTGGGWFFEGSFPIKVLDGDGTVIGSGIAQALSDWTSTGTVPFAASISFTAPHSATGTVIFTKDNPSGLPQNDASLSVPIRF